MRSLLRWECIGPSARKKRGPQDDKGSNMRRKRNRRYSRSGLHARKRADTHHPEAVRHSRTISHTDPIKRSGDE